MKKQMEILILLLLNMITTAFTNVVAAIKVLNDLITITKLSFSLGFRCNKFFMHLVLDIYIYFNHEYLNHKTPTHEQWINFIDLKILFVHFQMGIFVVYFLDNIMGSAWWVMVLYLIQLFAVMVVRGKPYGSEQIVSVIFPKKACCSSWIGPLLAFTWNVVCCLVSVIFSMILKQLYVLCHTLSKAFI